MIILRKLKKPLKIIAWILSGILLFFILLVVIIRLPSVQHFIVQKIDPIIEKKLGTNFHIDRFYISFPKNLTIEGLYLEDQKQDTLVSLGYLDVNIGLFGLINNEVEIDHLTLTKSKVFLKRDSLTGTFNFDFIIDTFAGDTTKQSSGSSWKIDADGIELGEITFQLDDHLGKNYIHTKVGEVDLEMDEINLDSLYFDVDHLRVNNTVADVRTFSVDASDSVDEDEEQTTLSVLAGELAIENSRVTFRDGLQEAKAEVKSLQLADNEFSLHRQIIKSGEIYLEGSSFSYAIEGFDTTNVSPDSQSESSNWTIQGDIINLDDNQIKYDNHSSPPTESGLDYQHLELNELSAEIQDLHLVDNLIGAKINGFHGVEKSGFTIENFKSNFELEGEKLTVKDLQIQTKKSSIEGEALFYLSSFFDQNHAENSLSEITFTDTKVFTSDISYFLPAIDSAWSDETAIFLQADLQGWMDELIIDKFQLDLDRTKLQLNGEIKGLPEFKNTSFDLPQLSLSGYSRDIMQLLPDTLLPGNLQVPDTFDISSKLKGEINDLNGNLAIRSSMGDADFSGHFKTGPENDNLYLNGDLEVEKFHLGHLLKNDQLGRVSMNVNFDGSGYEFESVNVDVNGEIKLLEYKEYAYKDIALDGNIDGQAYQGNLSISDSNLKFNFDGLVDMNDSIPKFDLEFNLDHANLQAMNFTKDEVIVHAIVKTEIETDASNHINGSLDVRDVRVIKNGTYYSVDSLLFASINQEQETNVTIDSDILQASLEGNIDILKMPKIIREHLDRYFKEENVQQDSLQKIDQQFTFSINLRKQEMLTEVLLPGIEYINISAIEGHFNNQENELVATVDIPQLKYKDLEIDSLVLNVETGDKEINGNLSWALLKNNLLHVADLELEAVSQDQVLDLLLSIPSKEEEESLQLGANVQREEGIYVMRLKPGTILFSGQQWKIAENNTIRFDKNIWIENLNFRNYNSQLTIASKVSESQDSTLQVNFSDFNLANLGEPLGQDTSLISGKVNGMFSLFTSQENLSFNADLSINNLAVKGAPIGEIAINNQYNNSTNTFAIDIQRENGKAKLEGTMAYPESESPPVLDVNGNLDGLELAGFKPFFQGQLDSLQGTISGILRAKGTVQSPDLNGYLHFNKVSLTPSYTSVALLIENQEISLKGKSLQVKNFVLKDEKNGRLTLSGNVNFEEFTSYKTDMNISTKDFLVFNTEKEENDLYYGNLKISGGAGITGNPELLKIDGNISVANGSNVVYQVPGTQASVISEEGLVNYIDQDAEENSFIEKFESILEDTTTTSIQGLDVSANISINDGSTLSIIVDQQTGDRLDVNGDANLSFNMPPNGDISLSGRYSITKGSYNLNFYELVKRKFDITEGSFIQWTGDPLEARLDVTTRYRIETLPPVSDITKRLPFFVNLHIRGEILEPELSFDLSMPNDVQEQYPDIYSFVQNVNGQETELNKQVFSLIVLNSFMMKSSQPETGDMLTNTARQSLSKILSQQLNRLAGSQDFVNLDFNLESYQVAGQNNTSARTDLELGLSKSFLDDRITIRVSGNVNIEGEEQARQQNLSDYAGDIILEYKLTEDGTYRLKAFSENEYDGLDQGEITETGIGIILVKDYNKISELFKAKNKDE